MRLSNIKIFDFFYRAYHAWPCFYESVTQLVSVGQWEKWQNMVFDDLHGKKILEIGVGPGKLLIRMAKKGFVVTGIELRRDMAYEARKRVKHAGLDIDILHQSVYHLPFRDETFDSVVMTFVLAEITQFEKALMEMKRVLRKDGKIIIVAGGMPQDQNMIARILFKMINPMTTLKLERNDKQILENYGFSVTRKDFGPFYMIHKITAVKLSL